MSRNFILTNLIITSSTLMFESRIPVWTNIRDLHCFNFNWINLILIIVRIFDKVPLNQPPFHWINPLRSQVTRQTQIAVVIYYRGGRCAHALRRNDARRCVTYTAKKWSQTRKSWRGKRSGKSGKTCPMWRSTHLLLAAVGGR